MLRLMSLISLIGKQHVPSASRVRITWLGHAGLRRWRVHGLVLIRNVTVRIHFLLLLRHKVVAHIATLFIPLDFALMSTLLSRTTSLRRSRTAHRGASEAWEQRFEVQGVHTPFVQARSHAMLTTKKS